MFAMSFVNRGVAFWLGGVVCAALLVVVAASSAQAGLLADDPTAYNGMNGVVGGITDDWDFVANLEFAVYRERASFLGDNVVFPGRFIYAYQLFNDLDSSSGDLLDLDVGVNRNPHVADIGYFDEHDGISCLPYGASWENGAESVNWHFSSELQFFPSQAIGPGAHSVILYFTSPAMPVAVGFTVAGSYSTACYDIDAGLIGPSHLPEPTTGGLLAMGAVGLVVVRAVRRRRVRRVRGYREA